MTTTTDTNMSDYKKEIIKEVRLKLDDLWEQFDCGELGSEALFDKTLFLFSQSLDRVAKEAKREEITENTSDGYHTFKELYEFRKIYNAVLFNEWQKEGKYMVHKSKRHSDGELCFGGGWFIVVAKLPTGQISNHYELKDWDLFQIDELERAAKWDGHTAQDVVKRLNDLILSTKEAREKDVSWNW